MPRVDTREDSFTLVTRIPLTKPAKPPVISAGRNASAGETPACTMIPYTHAERPMIDGKARSISPATTTNTRETDMITNTGRLTKTAE